MTVTDIKERERLLAAHRHIVQRAARRLLPRGQEWMEFDDLVSVGLLALDRAITQFDKRRGTKFLYFACCRVKYAMIREIERVRCPEVSFSNVGPAGDTPEVTHIESEVIATGMAERIINKTFWAECFEECLTFRERRIVRGIIWDRMEQADLAAELNISQQWVSEIYAKALTNLKEYLTAHGLDANTTLSVFK